MVVLIHTQEVGFWSTKPTLRQVYLIMWIYFNGLKPENRESPLHKLLNFAYPED